MVTNVLRSLAVKLLEPKPDVGVEAGRVEGHIIPLNCCQFLFEASVNIGCKEQFSLDKNNVPKDWWCTFI